MAAGLLFTRRYGLLGAVALAAAAKQISGESCKEVFFTCFETFFLNMDCLEHYFSKLLTVCFFDICFLHVLFKLTDYLFLHLI